MARDNVHSDRRLVLAAALAGGLALVGAGPAQAQGDWPAKPVRIVVPFPPGGTADILGRFVAQKLSESWGGKPVVIENKAGAGGMIGSDAVAKASPDGYTLLVATVGHAVNPYVFSKVPFDAARDFAPVATLTTVPSLLVVGASSPVQSVKDLLASARKQPGSVDYASSGIGSTSHVAAAMLESMTGVDMLHVPYKGSAPAMQDVMGGRVQSFIDPIVTSLPHVKAGRLRALAISSAERSPLAPEIPTLAEAGVPGYDFSSWFVLLAPAKTPPAVVERIDADLRRIAATPEWKERIGQLGGTPGASGTRETGDLLKREFERWAKIVKERQIRAE